MRNHEIDEGEPSIDRAFEPSIEAEIIWLSPEDQLLIAEALLNPPEPNDALREALRLHDENVEMR